MAVIDLIRSSFEFQVSSFKSKNKKKPQPGTAVPLMPRGGRL